MQAAARRLSALMATTALFAATPLLAHAASAAPADEAANVGEVVVTANKRSEMLKTVPASVQAVQADQLKQAGFSELRDLSGQVPSLTFSGIAGSGGFVIRGLSSGNDINPTTGLQINGAPIGPVAYGAGGGSYMPEINPAVISRVEVLKGPQGTLYGGSTLGGIVQFVTKTPNLDHAEGNVFLEGSGTDHGEGSWKAQGYFTAPLVQDKLAVQLSAYDEDLGGFVDDKLLGRDDYNSHRSWGGRAAVLWQVNPDFRIELSDLFSKLNSNSDQMFYDTATSRPYFGDLVNNVGTLPAYDSKFNMVEANADYDLHFAQLSYIGTYQTESHTLVAPYDLSPLTTLLQGFLPLFGGTPIPAGTAIGIVAPSDSHKVTQELRITSPDQGRLRWLAGAFYNHESTDGKQAVAGIQPDQNPYPHPLGDLLTFDLITHLTEVAGFGDLTYYVTPRLDVTGGVRVGHITQDYRQLSGGSDLPAFNLLSVLSGLSPTPADSGVNKATETFTTWLANVRYHLSDNSMAYFRFATGFRPGGPNTNVPGIPATFDPDTTKDYEVGLKTSFWDGRGYFDLNVFNIDWDKIQVQTAVNGLAGEINAGGAYSRGVEASLDLRPVDGLTLHAAGAYNDAKYKDDLPGGLGLKGDPLPNSAKWSGSLSARYEWSASGDWRPFVGGQLHHVAKRNTAPAHDLLQPNYVLPAYTSIDIQAGVRYRAYEATVFVRNLGDERSQLGGGSVSPLASYAIIGRPRTIGVSLNATF